MLKSEAGRDTGARDFTSRSDDTTQFEAIECALTKLIVSKTMTIYICIASSVMDACARRRRM